MKYLEDGSAVEVVAEIEAGVVVKTYYEDWSEDGEPHEFLGDNLTVVKRVFDNPPMAKMYKEFAELDRLVCETHKALEAARLDLLTVLKERDAFMKKAAQYPALKNIEDFIDGKITHYVRVNDGSVQILDRLKWVEDGRTYANNQQLLSLHGDSKGNLTWNLNKYSEPNSGGWTQVIPCLSKEDALSVAIPLALAALASAPDYHLEYRIVECKALGIEIPEEITRRLEAYRVKGILDEVDAAKKKVKECESRLLAVTAKGAGNANVT